MKVLLLSDRDYQLCLQKVEAELRCTRLNSELMRGWEKAHGCRWHAHKWIRKRSIEAHRLKRILSQ